MDSISGLSRDPRKSGFLATHKSYLWRGTSAASSYVFTTCRVHCSKEVPWRHFSSTPVPSIAKYWQRVVHTITSRSS